MEKRNLEIPSFDVQNEEIEPPKQTEGMTGDIDTPNSIQSKPSSKKRRLIINAALLAVGSILGRGTVQDQEGQFQLAKDLDTIGDLFDAKRPDASDKPKESTFFDTRELRNVSDLPASIDQVKTTENPTKQGHESMSSEEYDVLATKAEYFASEQLELIKNLPTDEFISHFTHVSGASWVYFKKIIEQGKYNSRELDILKKNMLVIEYIGMQAEISSTKAGVELRKRCEDLVRDYFLSGTEFKKNDDLVEHLKQLRK